VKVWADGRQQPTRKEAENIEHCSMNLNNFTSRFS